MKKTAKIVGFVLAFVILLIAAVWVINYIRMDLSREEAALVNDVRHTLNENGRNVSWLAFVKVTRAEYSSRLIRSINSNEPVQLTKGEYYLVSFSGALWTEATPTYVIVPTTREIVGYIPGT
jgi:hypothetical protein